MSLTEEQYGHLVTFQYTTVLSVVSLYYDWALTLASERERYWTRPVTLPAALFLATRYIALLQQPAFVAEIFAPDWSDQVRGHFPCHAMKIAHFSAIVLSQVLIGALLGLRTYALYNRSRWLLALLGVIAVGATATSIYSIHGGRSGPGTRVQPWCLQGVSQAEGIRVSIAWVGCLTYDTAIFVLTLARGLQLNWRAGRSALVRTLLFDGTLYYGVMACTALANIFCFILAPPLLRAAFMNIHNTLSTTLACRLMLHIHSPHLRTPSRTDPCGTAPGTPGQFVSTVVGGTSLWDDDPPYVRGGREEFGLEERDGKI